MSEIKPLNPLLDFLSKIGNYLIGVAIVCYGVGFAITNLYLGSMGIITFDLLKARYIIAGLLFTFFLGVIIYLVIGLIQTLRKNRDKPRLKIIMEILWYSLINIGLLYFVIQAVSLFSGSTGSHVNEAPNPIHPIIPWADWFAEKPLMILRSTIILFGIMIFLMFLVITIFMIINPKDKDGIRKTRKQNFSELYKDLKEIKGKEFFPLIGIFILIYLFNLSASLVSFYLSGKVSSVLIIGSTLPNGWTQFFIAIVLIYALIGIYLTLLTLYPSTTTSVDTALSTTSSYIYWVSLCIVIIVPLYAFRVYPALPLQIGGGQLQKVQVVISDMLIEPKFININTETFLIDKTTNTSFFMLKNTRNTDFKIVEIQNELIQSIIYADSP